MAKAKIPAHNPTGGQPSRQGEYAGLSIEPVKPRDVDKYISATDLFEDRGANNVSVTSTGAVHSKLRIGIIYRLVNASSVDRIWFRTDGQTPAAAGEDGARSIEQGGYILVQGQGDRLGTIQSSASTSTLSVIPMSKIRE